MVRHLLVMVIPLGAGLAFALAAAWRGWAPPLAVAVAAGFVLRLYVAVVAWHDWWQPPDYWYQFTAAIGAVLHHQDPLSLPNSEWHFLPTMAYVNAGAYRLGALTGVGWQVAGRAAPVAADVALILLVGVLAGTGRRRRWAAFQYALNPLAIMISAVHGQLEPVAIALAVGALILALRDRPRVYASGLLLGLAIAVNSWPALLIPGLLHALPGWRKRLTALACACAVPLAFLVTGPVLIGYPARVLGHDIRALLSPRGVIGDWGWTALITGGRQDINPSWARLGMAILVVVLAGSWYLWRRAHPVDLITAMSLALLVSSDRVDAQYLIWPVPFQLARPARGTQASLVLCSAWAGAGYLWLSHAPSDEAWRQMHVPWVLSSLVILPFLAAAIPWRRRVRAGGAGVPGDVPGAGVPGAAVHGAAVPGTAVPGLAGAAGPAGGGPAAGVSSEPTAPRVAACGRPRRGTAGHGC